MLTKDYLMRMIDTLVKALARLVFLKDANDYNAAFAELNNITKEFFGLDLNFVDNISDKQLLDLIGKNELLLPGNCYVFGVLLKEEGELFEIQGSTNRAINLYERSFSLFVEGLKSSPTIIEPDHLNKINLLIAKFNEFEITIETEEKLFFFYEFTGNYATAEDVIYNLIEYDDNYTDKGIQFCERLLNKSDGELIGGNLPREEVEESLTSLQERLKLKNNQS